MKDDINSLAHSKWNCKYHIVFAPKYRRMVIYGKIYLDWNFNLLKQAIELIFAFNESNDRKKLRFASVVVSHL